MRRILICLLLAAPLSAHAAFGNTKERLEALEQESAELSQRLDAVQRVIDNQSLLELMDRVAAMQAELAEIRGEVEELRHEVDGARQRQRDLYLDLDRRLRALELGGVQRQAPAESTAPAQTDAAPATATAAAPTRSDDGSDRRDYQAAFDILKEGRFTEAREAYARFLQQHPESPLSDNAQYWYGETFYVTQEHERAITEFRKVLEEHQGSDKAPDALLKIGFSQYELGRWAAARATLEGLIQQLQGQPGSETYIENARRRLERMDREGR